MINWIKKHWKLLVIIDLVFLLVLPIGINACYLLESNCTILQEPSDWTKFWATYIAAIASYIMITITAISIILNSKENKHNRQLLLYQNERQHFVELREKCIEEIYLFDTTELIASVLQMAANNTTFNKHAILNDLCARANKIVIAQTSLLFISETIDSPHFVKYMTKIVEATNLYNDMLYDVRRLLPCVNAKSMDEIKNLTPQDISNKMRTLLDNYIEEGVNSRSRFTAKVLAYRINQENELINEVKKATIDFLQTERHRIEGILQG